MCSTKSARNSPFLPSRMCLRYGHTLIDSCPREPTAAWAAHLRAEHPTLLFRAASSFLPPVVKQGPAKGKGKEKEPSDDAWGLDAVYTLLGRWADEKAGDGPLHVAVVGLTNVRPFSPSFSALYDRLKSGTAVGKEYIRQFAGPENCARRLRSVLVYQQPNDHAIRPRSDSRD